MFKRVFEKFPHVRRLADHAYILKVRQDGENIDAAFAYPVRMGGGTVWEQYRLSMDSRRCRLYCESPPCLGIKELARAMGGGAESGGEDHYVVDTTAGRVLLYLLLMRNTRSLVLGMEGRGLRGKGRTVAKIEILDLRENGDLKFRLWFYRWFETRPERPFVDIEVRYREGQKRFLGRLCANEGEGIFKEHLGELYRLLKAEGLRVTPIWSGGGVKELVFYGGFREELLRRIGRRSELIAAEPAAVKHLGGMRFEVDGRLVEFGERALHGKLQPYAVIQLGAAEEAISLYRRLRAAGVYAEVRGRAVRLNGESYWGMSIAAGITPEGYQRLYPLDEDEYRDLYVFKRVDGKGAYYQFTFRHDGVWRAVGGKYVGRQVMLQHADIETLRALKAALKEALDAIGSEAQVGRIGRRRRGRSAVYYLYVTRPIIAAFEERALSAEPMEVSLAGDAVIIRQGGAERRVEFVLLRGNRGILLEDASLYPILRAKGIRVKATRLGVKLGRDAMWGLVAMAIGDVLKRGGTPQLPNGVSLLIARKRHYIFRVDAEDGIYIYSVLRVRGDWTAMGGKVTGIGDVSLWHSEEGVAKAHAETFNELLAGCISEGRCRRKEAKLAPDGHAWYFRLSRADLEELTDRGKPHPLY
ncbi:MAG: hypothetical protein QXK62_08930 [Thermoproteus sp.]